jgi:tetratricopeptide (TPR) repeat protein
MLLPSVARAQSTGVNQTLGGVFEGDLQQLDHIQRTWTIFGRVTTISGDPIRQAKVRVDAGFGKPELLLTNLKGEFTTDVSVTINQSQVLLAKVVASKEGYLTAHETAEFRSRDKVTREIVVILRDESENSEFLSAAALVSSLQPRFRSPAVLAEVPAPALKDYEKGAGELFDGGPSEDAVSPLAKSVSRAPGCINCRLLLCLANLAGGGIASANQQQAEIDKLTNTGKMPRERATLLYMAGVMETWRNENKNAVGFFQKALEIQPSDPIVLQELGRTLLLQKNWEAADDYLEKAIKAGASSEAHLLRARALLEEGDVDVANTEMQAYIGDTPVRSLPLAARLTYLDLHQRLESKSLSKVKSVVDQPFPELVKAMPELKGMETAGNQDALPLILQKIGDNVAAFFRDFSNTISEEDIKVENLRADGQVKEHASEKSNYLLLAKPEKWGLGLTEYRATPDGRRAQDEELRSGFMRTKGFASASVVFHPNCQSEMNFRYLGHQQIEGREAFIIAFAQQPERAKMVGRMIVNGVSEPALIQGIAWVDAGDYQIIRLRTDLLKPLPKVRLARQTTEIQYGQVHFKDTPAGLWLPQEVVVTVQWKGRTFRNSHSYSNFKHFNVATEEKRKQT